MVLRSTAGYLINLYRDNFTAQFDHYDEEGNQASLAGGTCLFCDFIQKNKAGNTDFWYEDDQIVIFSVRQPIGAFHGLAVPKRHIRDINHLKANDIDLLDHMRTKGLEVLKSK